MPQAVADIIDHLSDLPPFPKVTARLLSLLNNPSVSVRDLAEVISTDPSLVMKVIHISNSPFYMVSKPIESVKAAVLILGIDTIKSITTAVSIQKGLAEAYAPRSGLFDLPAFWKHSYATAIVSSKIARRYNNSSADRLYLAGLIHDIGKLIIAHYWPETWKRIINYIKAGNGSYTEVELNVFSSSHCEIAASLCDKWQFPQNIVELIRRHHRRADEDDPTSKEIEILRAANEIVSANGFPFPEDGCPEITAEELEQYIWAADGLGDDVEHQLKMLDD